MSETILTPPAGVEQIAAAVEQMDDWERQRLLDLSPGLIRSAQEHAARNERIKELVAIAREEVLEALGGQPLSPDEPFLKGLTLGQFNRLSEQEATEFWDALEKESEENSFEPEVYKVSSDAVLAG